MCMLSLFPQLLFLTPLAPTILRLSVGVIFVLMAWDFFERREELGRLHYIVLGKGEWIPIISALVAAIIGAGLIGGIYTQASALLGALFALKALVWRRRYATFFVHSATTDWLLLVICVSLIFTGAGAFAFDLPL